MTAVRSIPPTTRLLSLLCAASTILLGLLVMIGWHARIDALVQVHSSHTPMVYNTALCFVLCGSAALLMHRLRRRAAVALGAVIFTLALLNGAEIMTGTTLGMNNLIVEHYISTRSMSAGQMAPNTVMCFLLLGVAIMTLGATLERPWSRPLAATLTGIVLALAGWALAGFLQGVSGAFEWGGMTPMALHTPLGFVLAGTSIMSLLWDRRWAINVAPNSQRATIGIDVKVSILISMLVLASSGYFAMWCFNQFNRALVEEELQELAHDSRAAGAQFTSLVNQAVRDVRFRASTPEITAYIEALSGGSNDVKAIRNDIDLRFEHLLRVSPDYLQIRIVGIADQGRELIRAERRGGEFYLASEAELQSQAGEEYFKDTIRLQPDQVHISRMNLNREHGIVQEPHVPVLRVSSPLYTDDHALFGFVIINIDIGRHFDRLRRMVPAGRELYIADNRGDFLLHPDAERCFHFEFGESKLLQDEFPALASLLMDAQREEMYTGEQQHEGEPIAVGGARVTFGAENAESTLLFATKAPYSVIAAASQPLRTRALSFSFVLVLITTIAALAFSQSFTRPLRRITVSVAALAHGKTATDLPIDANNEAGDLARAFAEMLKMRHLAEVSLARETARQRLLSAAIDSSLDGVIILDLDGVITDWNPAAQDLYGYTAEEAIGQSVSIIIPDDRREELQHFLESVRFGDSVQIHETVRRARDGKLIDVSITASPIRNEAGEVIGVSKIERDLAEQKRVEAQFRMAVESAPNGMVMVDQNGYITLVNPETERLFGYEKDELVGEKIEVLVPDRFRSDHPAQRDRYLNAPEKRPMGMGRDLFGRRKDGGEFPIEIGLNPIHSREGVVVLGTIVDITARKEHEARIKRFTDELLQKNEELQQFAYIASHDLQEPLRKIQAFGDMLRSQFNDSLGEEGQEYITRMQVAATRMRSLIDDLLTYSRVSTAAQQFEPVDLGRVVKDVLGDLMVRLEETGGIVNVGELPAVNGDETQLRQLFQNLIGNALKFHAEGVVPVVDITCRTERNNSSRACVIDVRDNGIGFDEKYIDRIFAPFQRLHGRSSYEGTGIGLAVCRKIVDRHHGAITAKSTPGNGATFTITLPLAHALTGDIRRAA